MNCENCKNWNFPSNALYQNMHTKGHCMSDFPDNQTYPDDHCDSYEFEVKTPEFHQAAQRALAAAKRQRFGEAMKDTKEDPMSTLQTAIDNLDIGRPSVDELKRGNPRNHGALPKESYSMQVGIGDSVFVVYKSIMKIHQIRGNDSAQQALVTDSKGKMFVLDADDVEFRHGT